MVINPNYAVIFHYSFDGEVAVYLFETEDEAVKFLRDNYEEELRIDRDENGWNSVGQIDADGWSATITYGDDVTYFKIGVVYS